MLKALVWQQQEQKKRLDGLCNVIKIILQYTNKYLLLLIVNVQVLCLMKWPGNICIKIKICFIFCNMKTHVIFSLYECHTSLCFLPSSFIKVKEKIRVAKNDYKWKFHTTKMWLILKHIISLGHFNKHKCPISEKCKLIITCFSVLT